MKKMGIFFLFSVWSNSLWSMDLQNSDNPKQLIKRTPSFIARLKLKMRRSTSSITIGDSNEKLAFPPEDPAHRLWTSAIIGIEDESRNNSITPEFVAHLRKERQRTSKHITPEDIENSLSAMQAKQKKKFMKEKQ